MSRRNISMLEISEVFYHWQKGQSTTHISKSLGISRPTIRKYLNVAKKTGLSKEYDSQETLKAMAAVSKAAMSSPPSIGSVQKSISLFDEQIKSWLLEPNISAKQIFQMLNEKNNNFSYTSVNRYIRELRSNISGCENKCPVIKQLKTEYLAASNNDVNAEHKHWLLKLLQGKITTKALLQELGESIPQKDAEALLSSLHQDGIRNKNRALSVLCHLHGIPFHQVAKLLMISLSTVKHSVNLYRISGINGLFSTHRSSPSKHEQPAYKDFLFGLLHSPPQDHGINRSSWTMKDLHRVMSEENHLINKCSLRKIIGNAGYRFRKAKKVLTSTDPEYTKKLEEITRTLSSLTESQKFFSIDEFGPFAVKVQGGRALTAPEDVNFVPQWQKSKGSLTLIGALELSTNQITHFYANRKSTVEMIKLMQILIEQYNDDSLIYLSWDAASWHASKAFFAEVARLNEYEYRKLHHTPSIALVPLPASAQFLNVIESIFSGMARAIIHNSDYASVEDCKAAIDRYFAERNEFFVVHPKRAGDKIWGKERVPPVFSPSNNCKDPLYR